MTGVFGRVRTQAAVGAPAPLPIEAAGRTVIERRDTQGHWWIAHSKLASTPGAEAPAPPAGPSVVVHGDIVNAPALGRELGAETPDAEAVVATLIARDGLAGIARLDGAFALTIVDPVRQEVVLATDPFGSHPIYWHADGAGLTFGSELRSVVAMLGRRPVLSLRTVADFLTLGFVLGDKTLAAGIDLLGPGTLLRYPWTTGAATQETYAEVAELYSGPHPPRPQFVDELTQSFQAAVETSLTGAYTFGMSLSGGLDSRALLCAADGHAAGLMTYTVGVPGCADQAIADRLSRLAGTRHAFVAITHDDLGGFEQRQRRMVELTDGMYVSHGLTEMLVLDFLARSGVTMLLRGHGGELAKTDLAWPLHTDKHVYELTDHAAFIEYLTRRANYVTPGLALPDLLTEATARLAGPGASESMRDLLADVPLAPAELCSYLYLREHHRRFTVPSLELFRTTTDIRLPFMDRTFLRILLSAPPEWREGTSLHRAISRSNPALLHVRNSNTGAPGDAGPLTEAVFDKINTILRRLNAPGYRHYHNFERWLRERLLESVERTLSTPEARIRLFIRPDALADVIQRTRRGTDDYSYLLQILLTIELWLQQHDVGEVTR